MARLNTPTAYKCSVCSVLNHNARTCPQKPTMAKAGMVLMKESKAARKINKAASKAAFAARRVIERSNSAPVVVNLGICIKDIENPFDVQNPEPYEDSAITIVESSEIMSELPIVEIPPALARIEGSTFIIAGGACRIEVPNDTKFEDIASFVQYVPKPFKGPEIALFRRPKNKI